MSSGSLFDDNGNPMEQDEDLQEQRLQWQPEDIFNLLEMDRNQVEIISAENDIPSRPRADEDDEPQYFINAAALSDEEGGFECMAGSRSEFTTTSAPAPPSQSQPETEEGLSPEDSGLPSTSECLTSSCSKKILVQDPQFQEVQVEHQADNCNTDRFVLFEKVKLGQGRARVPISRSFPDIIQTTLTEKFIALRQQDQADHNNYSRGRGQIAGERIATITMPGNKSPTDSLDELVEPVSISMQHQQCLDNTIDSKPRSYETEQEGEETTSAPKPKPRFNVESSAESQTQNCQNNHCNLLTSNVMGGISCEKPPDSWTIDFNSLSIEDTLLTESEQCRRSSCSTNSNSLAFFIDMNEPLSQDEKTGHTVSAAAATGKLSDSVEDPKKIFPMFIDLGESEQGKLKGTTTDQQQQQQHVHRHLYPSGGMGNSSKETYKKYGSGYKGMQSSSKNNSRNRLDTKNDPLNSSTISNRSSLHVANHDLDDMFASNLLSSMENSMPDEDIDSCLKLGMDLLRMFQEGINTDIQISVKGKFIKAHKCILASRSQYFAAILSGNMIEKMGNTIRLDEFSYSVVQFTLYHIYSGTNEIPDSIDLIELTSLTDVLGLEGLREIISNTIKAKFAHNFHRPCSTCIIGVVQFFPIAITYGMEELSRKMTKWISKHFVRIWPTKAFSSLGDELIEKCLTYTINHLSGENLLDITLGCDQLLNTMPNIKWAEPIFNIVHQLMEACIQFLGQNLCQVLQSQRFLVFGKGQSWNISRIENTFLEGLKLLKPDDACLSYSCLTRLIELGTETFDEAFVEFLVMLQSEVEKYLLANASKAVLSKNWERLSERVRKKICSSGFLGYDSAAAAEKKARASKAAGTVAGKSHQQKTNTSSGSSRPTSSSTRSGATASAGGYTMTKSTWKTASASQKSGDSNLLATPTCSSTREILSPTDSSKMAKVASVRPMPSQVQHQNVFSSRQISKPTTSGRSGAASSSVSSVEKSSFNSSRLSARNLCQNRIGARGVSAIERERSFDNSPTSSSSSYTNLVHLGGTQSKPMTPITPSRPKRFPQRNLKLSPLLDDKPPEPKKLVFLTNSEKAKAVSKPQLKMRSARSNSLSSTNVAEKSVSSGSASAAHSRQSSVGSTQVAPNVTPNLSQPSRYANNLTSTTTRRTLTSTTVALVKSPSPNPNTRTRVGSATTTGMTAAGRRTGNGATNARKTRGQNNLKGEKTSVNIAKKQTLLADYDSGSDSDLMTKSNIEIEASSGEPKMRSLAEIGRSSTFSKDEPTVLGKMDLSMEMDYPI